MSNHISKFLKGKDIELKALLTIMIEFYMHPGHDHRIDVNGATLFVLEKEVLITLSQDRFTKYKSGHFRLILFHSS